MELKRESASLISLTVTAYSPTLATDALSALLDPRIALGPPEKNPIRLIVSRPTKKINNALRDLLRPLKNLNIVLQSLQKNESKLAP
jgi:hypothetical protein